MSDPLPVFAFQVMCRSRRRTPRWMVSHFFLWNPALPSPFLLQNDLFFRFDRYIDFILGLPLASFKALVLFFFHSIITTFSKKLVQRQSATKTTFLWFLINLHLVPFALFYYTYFVSPEHNYKQEIQTLILILPPFTPRIFDALKLANNSWC